MHLKKFLMILAILLLISSCTEKVITPQLINRNINVVPHPLPVKLINVKFFVVTDENFMDFEEDIITKNGVFVFVGISVKDYENLSLNMQDLKRFIVQQKEIIQYYEKALQDSTTDTK